MVPPFVSHKHRPTRRPPGRQQRAERVPRVGPVGVEEVLGVVHDLPAGRPHQPDAVADHLQVLVDRDAEHPGDLELAALADDRHDRRLGLEQRPHARVVLGLDPAAAGHAERRHLRVLQLELPHVAEERGVLRVAQREPALDVVHAQLVQLLRDQQLVLERQVEPLALGPVPQGRVVDLDAAHARVPLSLVLGPLSFALPRRRRRAVPPPQRTKDKRPMTLPGNEKTLPHGQGSGRHRRTLDGWPYPS
jgi:hypothetical protein